MQKMVILTLAMDIVFALSAFLILLFDKNNTASIHSINIKSYFAVRRNEALSIRTALYFIDIVFCTLTLIALYSIWQFSGVSVPLLVLFSVAIVLLGVFFTLGFLKTIGLTKRISHRSLSSTH